MNTLKLGIDLQDLRTDAKSALRQAAQFDFRSIELPAAQGETTPRNLSPSGRRHLQKLVGDLGLSLSALSADFPGLRLTDPRTVDQRIEQTGAIFNLAADLGVPIVTTSVGALTHPDTGQPSDLVLSALRRLGEMADARGRILAIRPSHDSADRLTGVLNAVACPWIRVGLDPAALVIAGINPIPTLELFGGQISLMHMRDALRGQPDHPGQETPLGQGEVDLRGLLSALKHLEFSGPMILRRLNSQNPIADLSEARNTVRKLM